VSYAEAKRKNNFVDVLRDLNVDKNFPHLKLRQMPKFTWNKIHKRDWKLAERSHGHSVSSLSHTTQSLDIFAADEHPPQLKPARASVFIQKSSDLTATQKRSSHDSVGSLKTADKLRSLHPKRQAVGPPLVRIGATKVSSFKLHHSVAAHRKSSYNTSFDASTIKR